MIAGRADPKLVRAKLAEYLAQCAAAGQDPVSETHEFYREMASRVPLGLDTLNLWQAADARSRLQQQVLRELNLLTASGEMVKRGSRLDLRFYTPEAARRADERAALERRDADTAQAREQGIWERLEALGLEPAVGRGSSVRLEAGDWEKLVAMAEKGSAPS